ncbi:hypothetical protein [Paracoccus fontiphilus]|uniref:Uncharacterized protein n=1 Tax=Paracoccus fontiphilus TaxID=1815556 RepID=A0ABV7IMQ3_9RHOB|nr:hypothetical protein [Paracoccus fontiphilus]
MNDLLNDVSTKGFFPRMGVRLLSGHAQDFDTMVVSAPDSLKTDFTCYAAMADESEIVVERF